MHYNPISFIVPIPAMFQWLQLMLSFAANRRKVNFIGFMVMNPNSFLVSIASIGEQRECYGLSAPFIPKIDILSLSPNCLHFKGDGYDFIFGGNGR